MFRGRKRGRSREERAHAVFAFQELHVGCLVALLHDVVGHGESRRPSGSQPAEIAEQARLSDGAPHCRPKTSTPGALRELMKMSIEQAKRAFETFVATSEKPGSRSRPARQAGAPACLRSTPRSPRSPGSMPRRISRSPRSLPRRKTSPRRSSCKASTSSSRWRPSCISWRRCATSPRRSSRTPIRRRGPIGGARPGASSARSSSGLSSRPMRPSSQLHAGRDRPHLLGTRLEGPAGIVADGVEGLVDGAAPAFADGLEIGIGRPRAVVAKSFFSELRR